MALNVFVKGYYGNLDLKKYKLLAKAAMEVSMV